jgi:hypothetical protein
MRRFWSSQSSARSTSRTALSVAAFLESGHLQLDLTRAEQARILSKWPALQRVSDARKTLLPAAEWLLSDLGLGRTGLRRCLLNHPKILATNVEALQERSEWFLSFFGPQLGKPGLARMVVRRPGILTLQPEPTCRIKSEWLEAELAWSREDVARVIMKVPQVLELSIPNNVAPKLLWLECQLGRDRREIGKALRASPSMLSCSMEYIKSQMAQLTRMCLINDELLQRWVMQEPSILLLQSASLRVKLTFFQEQMGATSEQIASTSPRVFLSSLERRLKPRVDRMRQSGVVPNFAKHIWLVTTCRDDQFAEWIEKDTTIAPPPPPPPPPGTDMQLVSYGR